MSVPTEDHTPNVMLPERVPWLTIGASAFVVDVNPEAPVVLPVKIGAIDARTIRVTSRTWARFLQARMNPVPWTKDNPADHYGYSHFTSLGVYLVGPDNPHVTALVTAKKRKESWNDLQRAWTKVYSSRNLADDFAAAVAELHAVTAAYLKEQNQ